MQREFLPCFSTDQRSSAARARRLIVLSGLGVAVPMVLVHAGIVPQSYNIQTVGLYGTNYVSGVSSSVFSVGNDGSTGVALKTSGDPVFWGATPVGSQVISLVGTGYGSSIGSPEVSSAVPLYNAQGWVSSRTRWTNPSGNPGYIDTWVWNAAGGTRRIGLIGAGYESARQSSPYVLTASGKIGGSSSRANGVGAWVWLPDSVNGPGTTTEVGLVSGENVGAFGARVSSLQFLNDAGQAAGFSWRYPDGFTQRGQDSWVWNGTTTLPIGLTEANAASGYTFTRGDGTRFSEPKAQNSAGIVAGVSQRYTGNAAGSLAWVWDGTTTSPIGTLVPNDTNPIASSMQVLAVSGGGQVVGTTTIGLEKSVVWVHSAGTSSRIGLVGGVYDQTGTPYSLPNAEARRINDAGMVAGTSRRATAGTAFANDAWVYQGGTSTRIGLYGGVYVDSNGRAGNAPFLMNSSGKVAGIAERFDAPNNLDTWYWNGTTTQQIGLTGGIYLFPNGKQRSSPTHLNPSGVVVGYSEVGWNPVSTGLARWYFDPATGTSTAMIGSIRTLDGSWSTSVSTLTDDGFVLGSYVLYPAGSFNGETRAFAYRPDVGFVDLATFVNGGLAANGWTVLGSVASTSTMSQIVGIGTRSADPAGAAYFSLRLRVCANLSDVAGANQAVGADGFLAADDIIVFLGWFFANDARADVAGANQSTTPDTLLTADDIIVFLGRFFAGC